MTMESGSRGDDLAGVRVSDLPERGAIELQAVDRFRFDVTARIRRFPSLLLQDRVEEIHRADVVLSGCIGQGNLV